MVSLLRSLSIYGILLNEFTRQRSGVMEDNELETNEQLADDNQPSERRSGGTADYVKGTIVV